MDTNSQMNAQVMYNPGTDQLQVNPDLMVVRKGTTAELIWAPGANVTVITSIRIGNGWPYGQPTQQSDKTWRTQNPNDVKKTYKYDVTATTTAGTKELDPSIENEGPSG